jgi:hypothetical protein
VCDDWLSRVRDSLLCLSAAAGAQQHTIYHGMARLQELHSTLKSLTAHYQAQQQQLHQQHQQQELEKEKDRRQREIGASSAAAAAAASAAAAAAITGLSGIGQQQQQQQADRRGRQGKQQQGKPQRSQQLQQQQGNARASSPTPGEQTRIRSRHTAASSSTADGQPGSSSSQTPALQEQLKALSQAFQGSLLRLAAPVLSTLVLLVDALVQQGEASSIAGLQAWAHSTFYPIWRAVSRFYALDLSLVAGISSGLGFGDAFEGPQPQLDEDLAQPAAAGAGAAAQRSTHSTQLLLAWMRGAAAQAEGQYEAALQLHAAYLQSEACSIPLGQCLRRFVVEQMAACYAAVGDWQGLAGLTSSSSSSGSSRPSLPEPQQQQDIGVQHWALAGAAGIAALQQWQVAGRSEQQQQHRGQHRLPGSVHHHRLDSSQLPGLTSTAHTILNALAALESASTRSASAPQPQQVLVRRQKQGAPVQYGHQQVQDALPLVLSEVQAQLQELSSPQHILLACSSSSSSSNPQRWQQLAVLQLLHAVLAGQQQQQQERQDDAQLGAVEQLMQFLPHMQGSNQGLGEASFASSCCCCWDGALLCSGQLQASCFADVQCATPVIQVRELPRAAAMA